MTVRDPAAEPRFLKMFSLRFLPFAAAIVVVALYIDTAQVAGVRRELALVGKQTILRQKTIMDADLTGVREDILFLTSLARPHGVAASALGTGNRALEDDFVAFAVHHPVYQQIRVLNPAGRHHSL